MKYVAYVSTFNTSASDSNFSSDLMKIMNEARENNLRMGVHGVLLLSGQTVLQYLEGDSVAVAQLFYKISRDYRHKNVSVIASGRIDSALFPQYSMRLLTQSAAQRRDIEAKLLRHCHLEGRNLNDLDRHRLQQVLGHQPSAVQAPKPSLASKNEPANYSRCTLSLVVWPRGSRVNMTPEMVNLCSNLLSKPKTFAELLLLHAETGEEQLLQHLDTLANAGLLRKEAKSGSVSAVVKSNVSSTKNRFSQVLKRFIEVQGNA